MSLGTLYDSALKGDFNQIKVRLDQDKSLLILPDPNGRLLVHWASLGGHVNLLEYLIGLGSPIDPVDDSNNTPLILSASAGKYDALRLLIAKGAFVNHTTNTGQSALQYACSKGHTQVVKLLIYSEADINHADVFGATPLHRAASQGRADIVEMLLACPNLIIDVREKTGSTPLHLACEEDREAVVSLLVKAGGNLDVKNNEGKSPLDLCSVKLKKIISAIKS